MADNWRNDDRGSWDRERAFRDRDAWQRGEHSAGDRFGDSSNRWPGDDRRQDFGRESDYGAGYATPRSGFSNLNQRPGGMSDQDGWNDPRPRSFGDRGSFGGYRGDYGNYPPDYQDYADWQGPGNLGYGGPRFGNNFYRDRDVYGRGYDRPYDTLRRGYWRAGPDYGDSRQFNRNFWNRASDEMASWAGDDEAARRRDMDRAQGHVGKGPKGYIRSDDRIRDDVNDRLTDDWHIDAGDIIVTVSSGEVTLAGSVLSRDIKRHAEDIAESVSGVKHVQNNLRVTGLENQTAGSQTGSNASNNFNPRPSASSNLGANPNGNVSH